MESVQHQSPPPATQTLPPLSSITTSLASLPELSHPTDKDAAKHSSLPIRPINEPRDSGNWSASKHSSTVSNTGIHLNTILNSDNSPSRNSFPDNQMSGKASLHPPQQTTLPSFNSTFENRVSQASFDTNNSLQDSRRSSVDSRMNSQISHLAISLSSPYDSQNVSRTSLVSNLQHQRGIGPDTRPNGNGPLSPLGPRSSGLRTAAAQPRRAPVINPNPRSVSGMPDPLAAAPTKGYPWAFPDSDLPPDNNQRRSSSGSSGENIPSRQNSISASINSSIFTADSNLPMGQKRFSEDMPQTHHHSMQRSSISNLQAGAGAASGNYSRTPELRVSHKIAERKRRSEMKSLFDELNVILPANAGGKSSKWEILTRAIEHIKFLKQDVQRFHEVHQSSGSSRQELEKMRQENSMLREELNTLWQNLRRADPNAPLVYGSYTGQLAGEYHNHHHSSSAPPSQPSRPLLSPQNQWSPNPNMMQGVEYQAPQQFDHR